MNELSGITFAVIDTETTSSGNYSLNRICEIAIIKIRDKQIVDQYSTLVNPQMLISPDAILIHHITNEEVAESPSFTDISSKIYGMISNSIIVCHNTSFDIPLIIKEFSTSGHRLANVAAIDTVKLSRKAFPGLTSYSLKSLTQHFGIHREKSHRAYDDCMATVELFNICIEQLRKRGVIGIEKILKLGSNRRLALFLSEMSANADSSQLPFNPTS